jgi:hypothetical protein
MKTKKTKRAAPKKKPKKKRAYILPPAFDFYAELARAIIEDGKTI